MTIRNKGQNKHQKRHWKSHQQSHQYKSMMKHPNNEKEKKYNIQKENEHVVS
jgi:hypothetical protein